jgi:hypothetical protein
MRNDTSTEAMIKIERLRQNPLISPGLEGMDTHDRENINGPSLIRIPSWVQPVKGKYYLYFSHHRGRRIELAYSDSIAGPWKIYGPGSISMEETIFDHHMASPDVHIDEENRKIVMFFHGKKSDIRYQFTIRAVSKDGIHFECEDCALGKPYFRVFSFKNKVFALANNRGSAVLYASKSLYDRFEQGPLLLDGCRHTAVYVKGDTLHIFYSSVGDKPERILHSQMVLTGDWRKDWINTLAGGTEILRPEFDWEGAGLPLEKSNPGPAARVNQVRDPYLFSEGDSCYLLYTIAGESGIAGARLFL